MAKFFRLECQLRLYHWNTESFARHKASCDAIQHVVGSMDRIIETLLGSYDRANVVPKHSFSIKLHTFEDNEIGLYIQAFCEYLESWETVPGLEGSDILNLRDELLGHLKQVMYLMTLS